MKSVVYTGKSSSLVYHNGILKYQVRPYYVKRASPWWRFWNFDVELVYGDSEYLDIPIVSDNKEK